MASLARLTSGLYQRSIASAAASRLHLLTRTAVTKASEVDDERQIGDYPHVAPISAQLKDPTLYEDPQERRNLNDPLHEEDEFYSVWVVDEKPDIDKFAALRQLATMFAVLASLYGLSVLYNAPSRKPTGPRELPFHQANGKPKAWLEEKVE